MSVIRQDPDILRYLTTSDFIAKAYTDYSQSIAEEWSKFQAVFTKLTSSQPDWFDDENPLNYDHPDILEWIASELQDAGYLYISDVNNYNVSFTDSRGYIKYYWSSIIQYGPAWLNIFYAVSETRRYVFDDYCIYGYSNWLDGIIPLCNANGQMYTIFDNDYTTSVNDLVSMITETLNESVALYAACKCSIIDDVGARIASFNDTLSNTFTNVYDAGAVGISYFRSIISNVGATSDNLLQTITDVIGIENRTEETNIYTETTIGQYTGVSPVSAIDLSTAKGVIKATGAVIVSGAKKCWNLLRKGFSWISKKTKQYIVNPILNPFDLKKVSDSQYYSIDKFCIQWSLDDVDITTLKDYDNKTYPISVCNKVKEVISNSYFKCETIFGEFILQFIPSENDTTGYKYNLKWAIKPYCINPDVIARCANYPCYKYINTGLGEFTQIKSKFINKTDYNMAIGTTDTYLWPQDTAVNTSTVYGMYELNMKKEHFANFCHSLKLAPDLYIDIAEDNEKQMYSGFITALACIYTFLGESWTYNRTKFENNFNAEMIVFRNTCCFNINSGISSPTNKDWFIMATGWGESSKFDNNNFGFWALYKKIFGQAFVHNATNTFTHSPYTVYLDWFSCLIPNVILYNQFDKVKYPLDYAFVPYCKNNSDFNSGRFAIKTDAEVIKEANSVANIIAVVAVVAVTVLTGVTVVKTINRALARRRLDYKLDIERKLASGDKVTLNQIRKYKRANRKLNAAGYMGSNLQSNNASTTLLGGEVNDDEMADNIVKIRDIIN